jgi:hypothetical protein
MAAPSNGVGHMNGIGESKRMNNRIEAEGAAPAPVALIDEEGTWTAKAHRVGTKLREEVNTVKQMTIDILSQPYLGWLFFTLFIAYYARRARYLTSSHLSLRC